MIFFFDLLLLTEFIHFLHLSFELSVTSHNSLPETTAVGDAFLSTLIQMLLVEHIPTNLILMSGHRITEPNFHGDSTRQVFTTKLQCC